MAHFAKIENGIVTQVIVAEQDFISTGILGDPAAWVQTSYNTKGGVHYGADGQPDDGTPLRMNYAGIGYIYDETLDAFIPPQPYESWILNEETCLWDAPVAMPDDGAMYTWDEETESWVEME